MPGSMGVPHLLKTSRKKERARKDMVQWSEKWHGASFEFAAHWQHSGMGPHTLWHDHATLKSAKTADFFFSLLLPHSSFPLSLSNKPETPPLSLSPYPLKSSPKTLKFSQFCQISSNPSLPSIFLSKFLTFSSQIHPTLQRTFSR